MVGLRTVPAPVFSGADGRPRQGSWSVVLAEARDPIHNPSPLLGDLAESGWEVWGLRQQACFLHV